MKRSLKSFIIVVALSAILFIALSVKRVPNDHEALRVGRDGEVSVLEPGLRVVLPGYTDYLVYPTGEHTYRSPESGTHAILMQDGDAVPVAFSLTVSIPNGSAFRLYERFTEDFNDAIELVVVAAAEIEGATTSKTDDRDRFLGNVTRGVREQLAEVGISVSAMTLENWRGVSVASSLQDVDVAARPPRKLIIVGVDGGDWLNIQPLIDAGKLPNFKKLRVKGATGPLRSEEPTLSPLLWTTMATGKYPEEHGILNFTITDPKTGAKAPITRYYRKVDAWWNMLGDYGRKVAVAGWLATDPAEPINGVMVTDKVGYLAYAPTSESNASQTGSVSPSSRADEIAALVEKGGDIPYDEIERFMHISREEFDAHKDKEFDPRDSINGQILLYATTKTYENIAQHLLKTDRPDVLAVYFELVDATSHLFMLQAPPRLPDVSLEEFERFKDAVVQAYITQDEIIGRFMDRLDDDTVLMVISDHGFKAGESRLKNRPEIWAGNAAKWHRITGIIAFYGKGVKEGFEIRGASILDVTPTILAISGLPRAADMTGKILAQAFDEDVRKEFNPSTVATLERQRDHESAPGTAPGAAVEETMKKLEALGYITPDNADAHNNLGQRFQQRGDYLKAIEEFEKAIAMRPDFYSAHNNIAVCYGKLKRYDEAEVSLLKAIELKPDDFYAMSNLAVMNIERRRFDHAIRYARQCVATEPGYANGRITLGSVLAMMGDFDGAEKEFREALKLDPESESARMNLDRLEQARQQSGAQGQ